MKTVKISNEVGEPVEVAAHIIGLFAVHHCLLHGRAELAKTWTLTHIPSGCAMLYYQDYRVPLIEAAKELLALPIDWQHYTTGWGAQAKRRKKLPSELLKQVQEIIRRAELGVSKEVRK